MAVESLDKQELTQLREVIDQMTVIAVMSQEKRRIVQSMGIPLPAFIRIVQMVVADPLTPFAQPMADFKAVVEKKFGAGSFDETSVREALEETVLLEQDMLEQRKLAQSFDVDVFLVNKLVEIRSQSPLDQGEGLMRQLLLLYGLKESALPDVSHEDEQSNSDEGILQGHQQSLWGRYRQVVVDVVLGVGLGISAIALLT